MPDMTVAKSMPVIAATPANGAPAASAATDAADPAAEPAADFAAVLAARLTRPTGGAARAAAPSALPLDAGGLPPEEPENAAVLQADAAGVTAPDLASLLPGLPGLVPPPAAPAAGEAVPAADPLAGAPVQGRSLAARAGDLALHSGAAAAGGEREEPGSTAARQPAAFAVALQATAETAARAAAALEPRPAELPGEGAVPVQELHAPSPLAEAGRAARAAEPVRVDTPVGARGWDAEVGQKLVWLAGRQESRAELTLTPPNMGKVEVTISVSGDQTSALFVAASPAARDALEQALPRLREMLADAGISLGEASVNAESPQQGNDADGRTARDGRGASHTGAARAVTASPAWVRQGSGLIDTFA